MLLIYLYSFIACGEGGVSSLPPVYEGCLECFPVAGKASSMKCISFDLWGVALLVSLLQNLWLVVSLIQSPPSELQSLGAKVTSIKLISSLIRKLWDMEWDAWNDRNHILHINKGLVKMNLLEKIDNRIRWHLRKGTSGPPLHFMFLLNTHSHSPLSRPVCQRLSWLAAVFSTIIFSQRWMRSRTA